MHVMVLPVSYPSPSHRIRGIFHQEQVHALARAGLRIGVIAPEMRSIKTFSFKRGSYFIMEEKVPVYREIMYNWLPGTKIIQKYGFRHLALKLFKKYIKNHGKPDLVHVHNSLWAGYAALTIKRKYGIPFVLTEHSSNIISGNISKKEHHLLHDIYAASEKNIAVSERQKKAMLAIMPGQECSVIPNMVNNRFFESPLNEHDRYKLISIGFLTHIKGFDKLIEAFGKLLKKWPQFHLKIIGDGPKERSLKELASNLGIKDKIEFTGRMDPEKVRDELTEAGIFVLASKNETFGVVVAEAMASGLPIVATKSGGPEDIVVPETGLLCQVNEAGELAQAIIYIVENYDQYDPETIRKVAYEKYSAEKVAGQLIDVFQSVKHV